MKICATLFGIVAENNREYYAINQNCDFSQASDWVLENVLIPIGLDRRGFWWVNPSAPFVSANYRSSFAIAKPRKEIAKEILEYFGWQNGKPEIWRELIAVSIF